MFLPMHVMDILTCIMIDMNLLENVSVVRVSIFHMFANLPQNKNLR